jgi:glutamate-ammonia-ligase adenylyltransferase
MADIAQRLQQQDDKQWQQWCEAALGQGLRLPEHADFNAARARVWAASDYVSQHFIREPALLLALLERGHLLGDYAPGEIDRQLRDVLAKVRDEAQLHAALRQFRRYQMLRVIWRDLAGWADLDETLEDLSALADACVARSLDVLYAWQLGELGIPEDEQGRAQKLVVLGMGKLGARELNLSSDIDLIFTFPEHGRVRGTRELSNEQFFHQLARRLVQALDNHTGDGFVFRVDTRLRPFGESGPLVLSFGAMEDYYHSQAREWERYAMVKARAVAGEEADIEQLMGMLSPFVYRRYLDFGAIESLRDMKQLISKELRRKGLSDDIKLGPGGIREIEFIGQVFQIIRGGRDAELRIRAIQSVLRRLGERNLLPAYVVQELVSAYRFLRRVENRIQAWRDEQNHKLPEDAAGRLRLARAMGFADWEAFFAVLEHHRRRVQGHFDKVFAAPQVGDEQPDNAYAALWKQHLDDERAIELLSRAGFAEPAQLLQRLHGFREAAACRGLSQRGRERLDCLMPMLLEAVAARKAPDIAFARVLKLVEAVVRRTAYLALLVENPLALSQLVRLTSISPWIAAQLARHPLLLDELLDPRRLYAPLRRQSLVDELNTVLSAVDANDQEQQMERLRQFAQSNMLRVAAADLTGAIPLMVVSDYLTDIAEVAVGAALRQTWAHLQERHGRPQGVLGADSGFAVIGYGKLGGIELGYGSDLDLVFLHGNQDRSAMTDGGLPLANDLFYARLGQRLIHWLNTQTASGVLYEVDMRLRPNGGAGLLVSSLDAFAQYQAESAWTWEHQALLRARAIAGDPVVAEHFDRIRRDILGRQRAVEPLRSDVREMREKMRTQLDRSNAQRFDLKQGRGGIADIEFMVQYAVLRWACDYPDMLQWTDNIRLLEALSRHRLLPSGVAEALADAYRALRSQYHRYSLQEEPGLTPAACLCDERGRVELIWRELMESA